MTKIDIISGFLGAGKTTLIKRLIAEAYKGERVVLIENEFGQIGIDSGFLRDTGIEITEMNSGCICCSLVGDFGKALLEVLEKFSPDRIVIEPSGVGKLSDVIGAVKALDTDTATLNSATAVVDAVKCKMYMKNFGEFFNNQIESADAIILSHTDTASEAKIAEAVALIREHNTDAVVVTTPVSELSGEQLLLAMERKNGVSFELSALENEEICPKCGHHHEHHHHHGEDCDCHEHHHHHDGECDCHEHHHHHHDEECDCHEHHHHHHDEECDCHERHHHHHGEECDCHEHHHHHHDGECDCHEHHHHHADEVFTSIGRETVKRYSKDELSFMLSQLDNSEKYGIILRAKGVVASSEGDSWIHFDYVSGDADIRNGAHDIIGKVCIIGSNINEDALIGLFSL